MTEKQLHECLDEFFAKAEKVEGVSLTQESLRFDIVVPFVTWQDRILYQVLGQFTDRNPHAFAQTYIAVSGQLIPHQRQDTRKIFEKEIPFATVFFQRDENNRPLILIRCYIPQRKMFGGLETLCKMYSKLYSPALGIGWDELENELTLFEIRKEFQQKVEKVNAKLDQIKDKESLEEFIGVGIIA